MYDRFLLCRFNLFFFNYSTFLVLKQKIQVDVHFFTFSYLNMYYFVFYWFLRRCYITENCRLWWLVPNKRLKSFLLHNAQWRGYFSTRNWLYNKLNRRVGYNRFLWENRLVGSSIGLLLCNSYSFRLQSKKNKIAALLCKNDGFARCHFIPHTAALKRKHFSYLALGRSLLHQPDPVQTVYYASITKTILLRQFANCPTFYSYVCLKKINFFLMRYHSIFLNKLSKFITLVNITEHRSDVLYYLGWLHFFMHCIKCYSSMHDKEFNYFYKRIIILMHGTNKIYKLSSAKLFCGLSQLADKVIIARTLGIRKFRALGASVNIFKLYKKTYATFLCMRTANVNALFTSLWGRKHRTKIRIGTLSKNPIISQKKQIYFYTKILPKLKHRLRKRRHKNTWKRILSYVDCIDFGVLRIRAWRFQLIKSLNYWSKFLILKYQGLRYLRNFSSFFFNFKSIKYFSFLYQQFEEYNTYYVKQLSFLYLYQNTFKKKAWRYIRKNNLNYLYIYKHYVFCSKYFAAFSKAFKNQLIYFNKSPAVIFNALLFQNKYSMFSYYRNAAVIFNSNIRFQYQVQTYLNSWLLYNIETYKNTIYNRDLVYPQNELSSLFNTAAQAMLPRDPVEFAKIHIIQPTAIMQYDYSYLVNASLEFPKQCSHTGIDFINIITLLLFSQIIEVYRLVLILIILQINA